MARIFYSLSGEGRGHAARALAVVARLRESHEVTLFTYGNAYEMLAPLFRDNGVLVRAIRGPRLCYSGDRTHYGLTVLKGARFAALGLPALVAHLEERIRRERPHLVITDFEPALPRAAKRCGVPFVSLDHQHYLVVNDLSSMPLRLRWWGDFIGMAVRAYYSGQVKTIVSSFFSPPVKPSYREHVIQVGVLLRDEALQARSERRGHLVAYLRRFGGESLLGALSRCGLPVRIYGLGTREPSGGTTFHAIHPDRFLEDLATSEALVCTAGNQLVGEALHLGKPVLALPEPGNFEQAINAHFVRQTGAGDWAPWSTVTPALLWAFLDNLPRYRSAIDPSAVAGNVQVLEALQPYLDA